MMLSDRIDINPKIMLGKPVIRGTRVPVELILRKLGEGASEQDLLDALPPPEERRHPGGHVLCRRDLGSRRNRVAGASGIMLRFLADESCDFTAVRCAPKDSMFWRSPRPSLEPRMTKLSSTR